MKQSVKPLLPFSDLPIQRLKPLVPPAIALKTLTSPRGRGVYASSDVLFKGAILGRDSLEVAEDLLELKPRLVRRIILTLASLQGEITNKTNEEEPGKIVHEYRTATVDGRQLHDVSWRMFQELSQRWGGSENELAYYGSIDATPHFVRLVGAYCSRYGRKILEERVTLRSNHLISVALVVENSIDWIERKLSDSKSGLLEYKRQSPNGIINQVWKDSKEFYVHTDGEPVNHAAPIASIEVQGITYDALLAAGELFPHKKAGLIEKAIDLRDKTIELLWRPETDYFALGVDYDQQGKLRPINILTANPAELLDTQFFDDLPKAEKQLFISGVVSMIMSQEFLTDAGIRSRALKEAKLIDHWDYHGTFTTWPKETYDIAKGMRRQGLGQLARELENRLLNIVLKNREYPEFLYVDEWGRVLASSPNVTSHGDVTFIDSTNTPERMQAWTVSAIMAIVTYRINNKLRRPQPIAQQPWQSELEKIVDARIPRVKRYLNPRTLARRYPTYPYRLTKDSSVNKLVSNIKK